MQFLGEFYLEGNPNASRDEKDPKGVHWISPSSLLPLLSAFKREKRKQAQRAETHALGMQTLQNEPEEAKVQRAPREPLSPQEFKVLRLLVSGQTYSEMARMLIVSPNTIKTHVRNIYRKLGVSRRAEAIAEIARLHLL